jgi:hypothetical protein
LAEALESARDAIARASAEAARRSTEASREAVRRSAEASREAARKSAEASREAARRSARAGRRAGRKSADAARQVVDRLPEPEQVADVTRRAADKLFPERAKARRKAQRKRRRGLFYRGVGLAGVGLLLGWLTSTRKGNQTLQTVKSQASKATETARQRVNETRAASSEPSYGSGLTSTTSTTGAGTTTGAGAPTGPAQGGGDTTVAGEVHATKPGPSPLD